MTLPNNFRKSTKDQSNDIAAKLFFCNLDFTHTHTKDNDTLTIMQNVHEERAWCWETVSWEDSVLTRFSSNQQNSSMCGADEIWDYNGGVVEGQQQQHIIFAQTTKEVESWRQFLLFCCLLHCCTPFGSEPYNCLVSGRALSTWPSIGKFFSLHRLFLLDCLAKSCNESVPFQPARARTDEVRIPGAPRNNWVQ